MSELYPCIPEEKSAFSGILENDVKFIHILIESLYRPVKNKEKK